MATPKYPNGTPSWIELFTTDPDGAAKFYGDLFGWEQVPTPEEFHGYRNFTLDGLMISGCMKNEMPDVAPNMWTVYLASTNTAKTVESAKAAGMKVAVDTMKVGDLGVMAVVSDPGGAMVGIWEPGTHPGMATIGELNTPSWFELQTKTYDAAVKYYRDVFKWDPHTMMDEPGFRYTTWGAEEMRAGIMDASGFPDGAKLGWFVYFDVGDADATSLKAVKLGGSIIDKAEDTPYGRLATLVDPAGAVFKLRQPNA